MRPLIACIFIFCAATGASAQQPMRCEDHVVQYSAPDPIRMKDVIFIKRLPNRPARVLEEKDTAFKPNSPLNTAAFNRISIADTSKPGFYSNAIEVFMTSGKPLSWRIDVHELKDNVSLQWLNEDLLFVRAWWGRVASTDMIFEISSGRFIYVREANYGPLVQACEGAGPGNPPSSQPQ